MGYDTRYTIVRLDGDLMKFRDAFNRHERAVGGGYRFFGLGVTTAPIKWYEHDEHIVDSMAAANSIELVLHGEGSESGDVWEKRYSWHEGAIKIETFRLTLSPMGSLIDRPDLLVATQFKRPEHIARPT